MWAKLGKVYHYDTLLSDSVISIVGIIVFVFVAKVVI